MPVSLFYLKHHNIYSLFSKFVQINCTDISEAKFRFPDKNNLFACLLMTKRIGEDKGINGKKWMDRAGSGRELLRT